MPNLPVTNDPTSDRPLKVDLAVVAKDLKIAPENVEKTVELLDDGNTIPFITRFRKDLTGGLNERQILAIKQQVTQHRALAERKAFILKSIESQKKLTDELKQLILGATTNRRLKDLYTPFKAQKQSRAAAAKQQGLEPFAEDILSAKTAEIDLAARAIEYVRVDKGLNSVDDVIQGVGDILVEQFGKRGELKSTLRRIVWNTGKLVSLRVAPPLESVSNSEANKESKQAVKKEAESPEAKLAETKEAETKEAETKEAETKQAETKQDETKQDETKQGETKQGETKQDESKQDESKGAKPPESATEIAGSHSTPPPEPEIEAVQRTLPASPSLDPPALKVASDSVASDSVAADLVASDSEVDPKTAVGTVAAGDSEKPADASAPPKKKKKKKKKKKVDDPFKDYHDFKQPIKNLPHHRVLAINRGELAGKLKVRIQADDQEVNSAVVAALVPDGHPYEEFLKKCATETLSRVLFPSLEREMRRELTEAAEKHAVEVFANNLQNLLLQPPVRDRRVLAIDPGFKSGCGVAVLDAFGNLLVSGHVFVVGNQGRRDESKQKIMDWVNDQDIDVIAIGAGAACRQAEQMVSDVISEHFPSHKVRYVMVNEAGASIYSTSEIGREELPDIAPSIRSAVSIGRRLQDPLSELVKISPANIGVGMYQHDVKAKHLGESLDSVVEFCVNQIGVNVNTASPSLLKFVSGLNALTARRLVEHRQKINGFKNRMQLKEVAGIGEATFLQAAGFLRIRGGSNPLDSTSIHPESYGVAENIIARVKSTPEELFPHTPEDVVEIAPAVTQVVSPPAALPESVSESKAEETKAGESTEVEVSVSPDAPEAPEGKLTESTVKDSATTIDAAITEPATEPTSTEASSQSPSVESPSDEFPSNESPSNESPSDDLAPRDHLSADEAVLHAKARKEVIDQITKLEIDQIAEENSSGKLLVRDILMALRKPEWDPRDRVHKPIFRKGIIKLDDLKPEMQLAGQIVNVVDFGVFVDIGLGESSLVHVSQLSHQYVRDPHRFCSIGDVLKVWVSEIDSTRRRVKLTAIQPGSKASRPHRRSQGSGDKAPRPRGANSGAGSSSGAAHRRHAGSPDQAGSKRFDRSKSSQQRNGKHQGAKNQGGGHHAKPKARRPSAPAPPITDNMLAGDEPMRSFSDLIQFVKKKPEKGGKKPS